MNEVRQNAATGEWVIYAPGREERPHDFTASGDGPKELPPCDPECPFCPGNEAMLPEIFLELPATSPASWQTRVAPNKFPALRPGGGLERRRDGVHVAMGDYGRHEVIVESPRHDADLAFMSPAAVRAVLEAYHRRFRLLMDDPRNRMILIFRNHGPTAGTSLAHPHSQLIAMGFVPRHVRMREREAQRYFDTWGRCVTCDIAAAETSTGERVILANESFLAFVPFAAAAPGEVWIVPRRHAACFGTISAAERDDLAPVLREVLARLHAAWRNPDYNYLIDSSVHAAGEPHLHWHLRIVPRLTTPAGFEIGSGISINPSLPEEDAACLRAAVPPAPR